MSSVSRAKENSSVKHNTSAATATAGTGLNIPCIFGHFITLSRRILDTKNNFMKRTTGATMHTDSLAYLNGEHEHALVVIVKIKTVNKVTLFKYIK